MFLQVQQALKCIGEALDGVESASTDELRRTLASVKSLRSRVELLETKAASQVAQRERHGDGGAGLLSQIGGRSRSDAVRNVRTEAELIGLPEARDAVSEGKISLANASKLAQAARKTGPEAVRDDADLVQMAKTLPDDEFAQAVQRWTIRHQCADDLAAQHRRNRRNRNVRFWNGEDGSVQMRGSFDAEMGARIQQRLRRQAEQLRQEDRRRGQQRAEAHDRSSTTRDHSVDHASVDHTGADGGTTREGAATTDAARTGDQRMADALDTLLATGAAGAPPSRVGSRLDTVADRIEPACPVKAGGSTAELSGTLADDRATTDPRSIPENDATKTGCAREAEGTNRAERAIHAELAPVVDRKAPAAEIIIRADLAVIAGESGGMAEICGAGPIPADTLRRMACNSDVWIEIFGEKLTPLYETVASRAPTAAQRRALTARDGECIGCGKSPGECEAHHITPWQHGGKTRLDNLVLVCWHCHDLVHDHNWQVVIRNDRYRLTPPDPAHPVEAAPQRKPKQGIRPGESRRHGPLCGPQSGGPQQASPPSRPPL